MADLGGLAALGTGLLQGSQGMVTTGLGLRRMLVEEDARKRQEKRDLLATRLKALELSMAHPEYADQVGAVLGPEASDVTAAMAGPAGQVREADQAINGFLLNGDLEALNQAYQTNPSIAARLKGNAAALAAVKDAREKALAQKELAGLNADVERLMTTQNLSRNEALRQAAGTNPRRLALLGNLRHTLGPELTAEQQLVQKARTESAADVRDLDLGVIGRDVARQRILTRPGGDKLLANLPAFQGDLAAARSAGTERGRALALTTPLGEPEGAVAPLGARRLPERTVGDVLAGQRRAERGRRLSQDVLNELEARGLSPDTATQEQVTAAMNAADARARGRRPGGHMVDDQGNVLVYDASGTARPLLGPNRQPVKARPTATGTIKYVDENGQEVYGRVGAGDTIEPIKTAGGAPARPEPRKKSAVERALEIAARGGGTGKPGETPATQAAGIDPRRALPPPQVQTPGSAVEEAKRLMKAGHSKAGAISVMRQAG